MKKTRRSLITAGMLALCAGAWAVQGNAAGPDTSAGRTDEPITLRVSYAPAHLTDLYQSIAERFMETHPDIKIVLDSPSTNYAALTEQILRQAITNDLPDVAHEGLNQIRTLVDRDIAVPLNAFAEKDADWKTLGVAENLLSYASYDEKAYALPFAISVPVLFYNADLVKKAGGDLERLPSNWDEVISLSKKIADLDTKLDGHYIEYTNGGWSFQMLVGSYGGRMMTENEQSVAFDGPAGLQAMTLLQRLGKEGQPPFERNQARQAFGAGTLGILGTTSAELSLYQKAAGDRFQVKVGQFPVSSPNDLLPAAGNGIVMLTRDAKKQHAAWEYIKFAVGATGQFLMVQSTGYVPVNIAAMKDENGIGGLFKENPQLSIAAERLPVMSGWYSFPGENNGRIVKLIEDSAYSVVTLKQEPGEALAQLAKDVTALLPR